MAWPRPLKGRPRRIRVFAPDSVTARSPDEVPAADVGLDPAAVEAIWGAVVSTYETGLHPSLQLCVRRHGQVVLDRAIGHIRGNEPGALDHEPRVRATPRSLYNLFSASKVATAMLIHLFDDRGLFHVDDAVAEYIPEFAAHGKHRITLRHLLTHRAGIPNIPGTRSGLDMLTEPDRIIAALCDARPLSRAGVNLAYHALTGGFLLAEILRRTTGRDVRQLMHEEILDPLGFEHFNYGVKPEEVPLVAVNTFTGPRARRPYAWLLERSLGLSIEDAVTLSNDPRFLTGIVPAGNIISSANEASRFFELLLREGELDGVRVLPRRTVRRAIAEQTYFELDTTMMLPIRYGMGFMLGGEYVSFYGPGTPRAFGHLGFTNVLAWADQQRDISVALMNNGKPFIAPRLVKWINIMITIARRVPRR